MALDPEIAALLKELGLDVPEPAEPPTVAEMRETTRAFSLALSTGPPIEVGAVTDDRITGVPVRIYRPEDEPAGEGAVPTVVYFHGGGFVTGDLDTHDGICRRLCRDLAAVVVAVAYRLAPEFPFPAGFDDCVAVTSHVGDHIADYGGCSLAVAGDSAGGSLAAGVALAFRDEGRPLAAQFLAYPGTDLSDERHHRSLTEHATGYVLTRAGIDRFKDFYLSEIPAAAAGAPASPLLADSHEGLPPAVIGCAEFDPLRDEGLAYADALLAADVVVDKHVFPGLVHGFLHLAARSQAAEAATARLTAEFGELLRSLPR
ncbi:alpha/beta hydrolase [Streptomyces sp. NPDC001404]|uniref:alpha/beta hydrolase n=1 Tax=Streptomyces sp. NPDC001404 TaxID=3364571 RepID=UPI00367603FF